MATPFNPRALRPAYNQASVQRYAGSTPINVRMLLVNSLLIAGCIFVMLSSLDSYNDALADFERISKVVATSGASGTMKPCGLAVPRTLYIMQSLKGISSDPFVEPSEAPEVTRVRNAFCGIDSVTDALRSALLTTVIPDSCCAEGDNPTETQESINSAVKSYLCACDAESVGTCSKASDRRGNYGDILRRLRHAYVLAAPAFAVYADTQPTGHSTCTRNKDPYSAAATTSPCLKEGFVRGQLAEAAKNTMHILSGEPATDADAAWPTYSEILYRLLALSVVEFTDRRENGGQCYRNANSLDPVEFCTDILSSSQAKGDAERPFGVAANGGCANASRQLYYSRILESSTCGWTDGTDATTIRPSEPTRRDRVFSDAYTTASPVVAVCASQLEFGLMDQKRLFGLIDPITEFEWFDPYFNNTFTNFLASWSYSGLYMAHVEKTQVVTSHSPYNNLKLYVGYRLASTSSWSIAAIIATGYLLAYAAVPLIKLLYVRLIRRTLTSDKTGTIVVKPAGTPEFISLGTVLVVGLWIIFVDPAATTPYPIKTTCENYLIHGGPFETTMLRAPKGLIGAVLAAMGAGLLGFLLLCRRKPRKKRVLPLKPFNVTPMYVIIVGVLLAIFILSIQAGDDWVRESATDQTGNDSELTEDLDELLTAGLWTLMMLALLTGVLNQRSMAANAALENPFGRVSVFALIWAGLGIGVAALAAVFSWPLFNCEDVFTSNKLTCGDGTRIDVRWNRFWGSVAWGLSVFAILFVFFAAYRVLTAIPKKARGTPFGQTKDSKVASFSSATQQGPRSSAGTFASAASGMFDLRSMAGISLAKKPAALPATSTGVVPAATVVFGKGNGSVETEPLVSSYVP